MKRGSGFRDGTLFFFLFLFSPGFVGRIDGMGLYSRF